MDKIRGGTAAAQLEMAKAQPLARNSLHRWGLSKAQKSRPAAMAADEEEEEEEEEKHLILQTDPHQPG